MNTNMNTNTYHTNADADVALVPDVAGSLLLLRLEVPRNGQRLMVHTQWRRHHY